MDQVWKWLVSLLLTFHWLELSYERIQLQRRQGNVVQLCDQAEEENWFGEQLALFCHRFLVGTSDITCLKPYLLPSLPNPLFLTFSSLLMLILFLQIRFFYYSQIRSEIFTIASAPLIPHSVICRHVLLTPPSEHIQNSVTFHHFHCGHLFPDNIII